VWSATIPLPDYGRVARDTPAIVKKSNQVSNSFVRTYPEFYESRERLSEGDLPAERRTRNFAS
jgi:hypothetical protein